MKQIFAEHAWLGPGRFADRVLVDFESQILNVTELPPGESPPAEAERVQLLTPGFINAHCHLEYSWLGSAALPRGPVPFGDWMRAIIAARPQTPEDEARRLERMKAGAQALVRGGCTTVVDSTTDVLSGAALSDAGVRHFLFHEVLGLSQQRAEPMLEAALGRVTKGGGGGVDLGNGLNPHAPYSVGVWLREQLRRADMAAVAQGWHVSETQDEDELFRSGKGSIAEFLNASGMPMPWDGEQDEYGVKSAYADLAGRDAGAPRKSDPGEGAPGKGAASSAFEFLRDEGMLDGCVLAFHGNTLNAEQASFFSAPRGLVHCPGTHRWFARPQVPLQEWLAAGANVCLGTDSLASSDSLSMLEMIRMSLEDNPSLTADEVLQMACSNPAKITILKEKGLSGVMRGKEPADFVALKTHNFRGWNSALTDPSTAVTKTLIAGRTSWSATET